MNTKIINYNEISDVLPEYLSDGKIIAFPTETVYGIGGDIFNVNAIYNLFLTKHRDLNKPLAAHIGNIGMVKMISDEIPDIFYKIAEKFLPGPLSVIIPRSKRISSLVTSGLNTIGIRFPDNNIFTDLCNNFGRPLAATSANESGNSDTINTKEVLKELDGKIEYIIDGGETPYKKASTVLNLVGDIKIFREGAIKKEEIEDFLKIKL